MRNKLDILYVEISKVDYSDIQISIKNTFLEGKQIVITGANVNTINLALENLKFREVLSNFNLLHPDGIGVFLASKFLYGKNGFSKRITGSDFYIELIKESLKNNWSFFFFGDTDETLSKISKANPDLYVKGFCNGFNFNNDKLIKDINTAKPDILIVGLGSPKQEDWIVTNRDNVNAKVIVAVGDGIKVFAGTKKRGTKLVRILGLEWFVRLINEPKRLWKRYIIGIPLFILRVLKYKLFKQ
ncbi:MAG TPA: WecB/TagA/CpsF family glycosyltransferase [Ignavibacteriaceae bacterium]|nr:WecB/TagA/CpsF family glycosyltransferase [Ignavibacteriaceae bacterium]